MKFKQYLINLSEEVDYGDIKPGYLYYLTKEVSILVKDKERFKRTSLNPRNAPTFTRLIKVEKLENVDVNINDNKISALTRGWQVFFRLCVSSDLKQWGPLYSMEPAEFHHSCDPLGMTLDEHLRKIGKEFLDGIIDEGILTELDQKKKKIFANDEKEKRQNFLQSRLNTGMPTKVKLKVYLNKPKWSGEDKYEEREFIIDNTIDQHRRVSDIVLIDMAQSTIDPTKHREKASFAVMTTNKHKTGSPAEYLHDLPSGTRKKPGYSPYDLRREAWTDSPIPFTEARSITKPGDLTHRTKVLSLLQTNGKCNTAKLEKLFNERGWRFAAPNWGSTLASTLSELTKEGKLKKTYVGHVPHWEPVTKIVNKITEEQKIYYAAKAFDARVHSTVNQATDEKFKVTPGEDPAILLTSESDGEVRFVFPAYQSNYFKNHEYFVASSKVFWDSVITKAEYNRRFLNGLADDDSLNEQP